MRIEFRRGRRPWNAEVGYENPPFDAGKKYLAECLEPQYLTYSW